MEEHDLRWKATPKGLVRATPWGWLAKCKCGWEQEGLAGDKKQARWAYYNHRKGNND